MNIFKAVRKSLGKTTGKLLFAAVLLVSVCAFSSCTSEIDLELMQNGEVAVKFNGVSGVAFETLIKSAMGLSDAENTSIIFDTKEISYEMAKNGFENVKATSNKGTDLAITMEDKTHKSTLFTSGVAAILNNKLKATLSAKNLKSFYSKADDQTVQFLDILLSPVFNDEVMSEEEYLEVISSFYGEEVAEEIRTSNFRVTLRNPDGSKSVQNISISKLLTLNEIIVVQ